MLKRLHYHFYIVEFLGQFINVCLSSTLYINALLLKRFFFGTSFKREITIEEIILF